MDKEIIIDGIDVSECEYLGLYKECKLKCGSCCPVDCSDNPNCHYKLYKRKEKECEEYEQALDEIEKYLGMQQKYFDGEDYHNLLDIINKVKKEK